MKRPIFWLSPAILVVAQQSEILEDFDEVYFTTHMQRWIEAQPWEESADIVALFLSMSSEQRTMLKALPSAQQRTVRQFMLLSQYMDSAFRDFTMVAMSLQATILTIKTLTKSAEASQRFAQRSRDSRASWEKNVRASIDSIKRSYALTVKTLIPPQLPAIFPEPVLEWALGILCLGLTLCGLVNYLDMDMNDQQTTSMLECKRIRIYNQQMLNEARHRHLIQMVHVLEHKPHPLDCPRL